MEHPWVKGKKYSDRFGGIIFNAITEEALESYLFEVVKLMLYMQCFVNIINLSALMVQSLKTPSLYRLCP